MNTTTNYLLVKKMLGLFEVYRCKKGERWVKVYDAVNLLPVYIIIFCNALSYVLGSACSVPVQYEYYRMYTIVVFYILAQTAR